jgi:hypothetical protein
VVICSPGARANKYDDDGIHRFANYCGADHIIPVLIAGIPNNESNAGQEQEMAFSEAFVLNALDMTELSGICKVR